MQVPDEWEKLLHALAAPAWVLTIAGVATMTVKVVLWMKSSRNGNGNGHRTAENAIAVERQRVEDVRRIVDRIDRTREDTLKAITDSRHTIQGEIKAAVGLVNVGTERIVKDHSKESE